VLKRERPDALIVTLDPFLHSIRKTASDAAARVRLPAISPFRSFTFAGGLMPYGIEPADLYKRAAPYIDRILRGEKPGDLPVQLRVASI
jgi:putative tryptophan/tyrosine transport system substrate-binding protein